MVDDGYVPYDERPWRNPDGSSRDRYIGRMPGETSVEIKGVDTARAHADLTAVRIKAEAIDRTMNGEWILRILQERMRQDEKWGEQNHDDQTWYTIFMEEVGEIAKALIPAGVGGHVDEANLDEEIDHAAAVLVAWMQARTRR